MSGSRPHQLALSSARDERLDDAALLEVSPHPDASCLLVTVTAPAGALDAVRAALEDARSYLRREVAGEIHRKRAPTLVFAVVPRPPPSSSQPGSREPPASSSDTEVER